jgi:hypothetical protein
MVALREVRAANAAGKQHVAHKCALHLGRMKHHMAGRVARAVAHVQHLAGQLDRVAIGSQRVGVKASECGKPNIAPCCGRPSIQNWSPGCGPMMGSFSFAASSAVPPAWSMWAWVSQICSSFRPRRCHFGQQYVQVAAGVDDGGLVSWRRPRRGSSFAGRGDGDGEVLEHGKKIQLDKRRLGSASDSDARDCTGMTRRCGMVPLTGANQYTTVLKWSRRGARCLQFRRGGWCVGGRVCALEA